MTSKKTIAVVGATGAQGGALTRAIMADTNGPFTVRAITRKPGSPQAQALAAAGAQVVTGDSDQGETMKTAFAGADGVLELTFPLDDKKLPGIAVEDIGKCAYAIFKRGAEFVGRTVGISGGHPTGAEMATAYGAALGRAVRYNNVPPDVYRSFGFPGADDLGNMFQFKRDFNDYYCGARDLAFGRSLNPEMQTLDQWMEKNKGKLTA